MDRSEGDGLHGGRARLRWAPRVPRARIRKLYEQDAQGIVDQELTDEVAYGFYARCQSILTVTEASHGRVNCPVCEQIILRQGHDREELLRCALCGWGITWGEYLRSYRRRQLHGGGAVEIFQEYVERLPLLRSHREKMLLIDRIVHECHKMLTAESELTYTRPVAVNLIEGSMAEVIQLLEELAYGPQSAPGTEKRRDTWRARVLAGVQGREKWLDGESSTATQRKDG